MQVEHEEERTPKEIFEDISALEIASKWKVIDGSRYKCGLPSRWTRGAEIRVTPDMLNKTRRTTTRYQCPVNGCSWREWN